MNNKKLDEVLYKALEVAKSAAEKSVSIIEKYYQAKDLDTEVKGDETPVTIADKLVEQLIRVEITAHFPDHGIYGEEFGRSDNEDSDFLWLIDPIDGTKSFVRQYPFFSTQIALMHRGDLVMGVSNAPIFGELAWAIKGQGAYLNGKLVKVVKDFAQHSSCISTGNIQTLVNNNWQRLGQLLKKFSKIRGYGDFYHYHLLASGKIDLVVESDVNILDIAALTVIVREAGGVVTDIQGKPVSLEITSILAGTDTTHALGLKTLHE